MLKRLHIQNIILIEKAEIPFTKGLNILTGETGAGKSAIMKGLSLIIGERADHTIVRKGYEKGSVEAIFEIHSKEVESLLKEGGIDHEEGEDLIIRRELSIHSKGRIFINHQIAQLSFLKKLGEYLVHMVGQHANQELSSLDYQRNVLDLYGDVYPFKKEFEKCFLQTNVLTEKLHALKQKESQRFREIDSYRIELEELEEAQLKEGEEEELFNEYTLLFNSEEISSKITDMQHFLSEDKQSALATLNRQKQLLESIAKYDSALEDLIEPFQNAVVELQEIAHSLQRYQSRIDSNPLRLNEVDERLKMINRLKRKYGPDIPSILQYYAETKKKLYQLENSEAEIESLEEQLALSEKMTVENEQILSTRRKQAAERLQKELSKQLQSLNMPRALFRIDIREQKRTTSGIDRIEFFISPNLGEEEIALKESASGGEMSRVLLALHTLLADKERSKTIIFDEIDANIGGETAKIVGDKLRKIGTSCQVICITHFPQVAAQADHHLQISKQEKEGRTRTEIKHLKEEARQNELSRMAGLKK